MNPGEVVLAHNINRIAPKGEDFVFVLLGSAPRKGASPDGKPFNVDQAMERLGWRRPK
jgi:hypothetical protein